MATGRGAPEVTGFWTHDEPITNPLPPKGCRTALMVAAFMAFFQIYAVRVSLGVVLVSMTRPPWTSRSSPFVSHSSNSTAHQSVFCRDAIMVKQKQSVPFQWDPSTQGIVLAAFFYGYILTQAPGRLLARKCGGRCAMLVSLSLITMLSFVTPVLTKYGDFGAIAVLRAVDGLVEGLTYPAMYSVLSKWAPPLERGTMVTVVYAGSQVGTILAMPVSGLMAYYIGWEAAFYSVGALGVICCLVWVYYVYDSPSVHPRIDPDEREHIETSLRQRTNTTHPDSGKELTPGTVEAAYEPSIHVPWEEIFRSMPVHATAVSHFASNWTHYTMLTCLPMYLHSILRFNVHEVGLLCALPFTAMWIVMVLGGRLANALLIKRILSTSTVRQLFNTLGFLFPAGCLLGLSFAGCNAILSVVLVTVAVGLSGLSTSGWTANHLDIAPPFAVELVGITNLFGTIPGIVAPSVVAAFVEGNRPRDAWRYIFITSTGVYAAAMVFYWVYGSGRRQWWSYNIHRMANGDDSETPTTAARPHTTNVHPAWVDDREIDTDVPETSCSAVRTDDGTDPYGIGPVQTLSDIGRISSTTKSGDNDSWFPSRRRSL